MAVILVNVVRHQAPLTHVSFLFIIMPLFYHTALSSYNRIFKQLKTDLQVGTTLYSALEFQPSGVFSQQNIQNGQKAKLDDQVHGCYHMVYRCIPNNAYQII